MKTGNKLLKSDFQFETEHILLYFLLHLARQHETVWRSPELSPRSAIIITSSQMFPTTFESATATNMTHNILFISLPVILNCFHTLNLCYFRSAVFLCIKCADNLRNVKKPCGHPQQIKVFKRGKHPRLKQQRHKNIHQLRR